MNIHEYGGRSGSRNTGGCRLSPVLPSLKLVLPCCGEGNGNPLQYSGLENSMDRGAWQTIVHGVIEADTTERITPTDIQNSTPGKRRKTWCWHSHYLASQ